MSTLSVSQVQNTASPVVNLVLNANGSTTLGLYRTPGVAPTPVQTGTLWYDIGGAGLVIWDGANWVSPGGLPAATLAQAAAGVLNTVALTPQSGVPKDASGMTGSAYIPAGTTAQRPTASNYTGQFRYNTTIPQLEYSDGAAWLGLGGLAAATLVQAQAGTLTTVAATPQTAVPKDASGMTGSAYLPAGTTAQRPVATAYTGQFRYNITVPQLEYSDGAAWQPVSGSSILPASLAEAQAGTITTKYSSPETAVPKDAAGMTGAAILPAGTDLQRPTTPVAGMTRYSTATNALEYYQASTTSWQPVAAGGAVVKAFVNIGITPAGVVTIFSSYNVASVVNIGGFYYDVTFTNPFPNTAYAVVGSAVSTGVITLVQADPGPVPTSTAVHQVRTYYPQSTTPGTAFSSAGVWTFSASWIFVSYP